MNKKLITRVLTCALISCAASCDDKHAKGQADQADGATSGVDKDGAIALLGDGSIDGNKLSLGHLSDILDDGLTMQKAKEIFGKNPLVMEDGKSIELRYAVTTNKIYVNGMRITSISIYFKNDLMTHASINCTKYES